MSADAVSVAVRIMAIVEDIVRPVLTTMNRERWPQEFRRIVLNSIARRFQEEADKGILASRDTLPEATTNTETG